MFAELFSPLPPGTPRAPLECISEEEEATASEISLEDLQLMYSKDWASLLAPKDPLGASCPDVCTDEVAAKIATVNAEKEKPSSTITVDSMPGVSRMMSLATPCRVAGFADADSDVQALKAAVNAEASAAKDARLALTPRPEHFQEASDFLPSSVWQKLDSLEQNMNKLAKSLFESVDQVQVRVEKELSNFRKDENRARLEFTESFVTAFEKEKKIIQGRIAELQATQGVISASIDVTPSSPSSLTPARAAQNHNIEREIQMLEKKDAHGLICASKGKQPSQPTFANYPREASSLVDPIPDEAKVPEPLRSDLSVDLLELHHQRCQVPSEHQTYTTVDIDTLDIGHDSLLQTSEASDAIDGSKDMVGTTVDIDMAGAVALASRLEEIDLLSISGCSFMESPIPQDLSSEERLKRDGLVVAEDPAGENCASPSSSTHKLHNLSSSPRRCLHTALSL